MFQRSAYPPDPSTTHHANWRTPKGFYSEEGLTPPFTGLSYPETLAFPRGAKQSRFPLVPLPHFYDLISPPAKAGLRRSVPNVPQRGFTPLRCEQGLSALPRLPCPCRPTFAPIRWYRDWVEKSMSALSARYSRTSQHYPACSYGGFQRLGESSLGVPPMCVFAVGGLLNTPSRNTLGTLSKPPRMRVQRALARSPALHAAVLFSYSGEPSLV